MAEAPGSSSGQGPRLTGEGEQSQVKLLVNKEGRYVCLLCHKTFKTVSAGAQPLPAGSLPPSLRAVPEPCCPSPTGQHPQGPHGHPQ